MTRQPANCEPATTIIRILGGTGPVSDHIGITQTQVGRWRVLTEKGGTDGYIPRKYHDQLREMAKQKDVDIPVAAFFDAEVATATFPRVAA